MDKVKVDSNDLFIIYYLVKLMEEEDDEQLVEMTMSVMLIPVFFALHPENHALNPE